MDLFEFDFKNEKPVITVVVPMFRALYVGWICMESLSRQVYSGAAWELVIAEETEDPETFGINNILSYKNRLVEAGCCKLTYIGLSEWIPLADKLSMMLRYANENSLIFTFHAADFYSSPYRLLQTYKIFKKKKVVWFIPPKVFMYHLQYNRIILVDKTLTERRDDTPGKSIRASVVRSALNDFNSQRTSVDGLLYKACSKAYGAPIPFTTDASDLWKGNISIEGIGTISGNVFRKLFKSTTLERPYRNWNKPLDRIVPRDIASRIKKTAKFIKKHNSKRPSWERDRVHIKQKESIMKWEDSLKVGSFIHPTATIGKGTKIGAHCVIEANVVVGKDCKIGHHVVLKSGTIMGNNVAFADYCCTTGLCYIGNNVAVRTRSTISKGVIVEDRAFIGAGVMSSHTKTVPHCRPDVEHRQLITRIGVGAIIGSKCNLMAGITIGTNIIVGYMSNVVKDLTDFGIYFGNPAKKVMELPPELVVRIPPDWKSFEFTQEALDDYLPFVRGELHG